jgi:hypothetical protein
MKVFAAAMLGAACASGAASEQEIQRALIQRDQQSAEFAARVRGQDVSRLEQLHARQLQEAVQPNPELRPYQRQRMADERSLLVLPPPVVLKKPEAPLPLPGGPRHGVDPIPAQSLGH